MFFVGYASFEDSNMDFSAALSLLKKPGERLCQAATKCVFTTSATAGSENVTVLSTSPAAQQPSLSRSPTSWWKRTGFPSAAARLSATSRDFSQRTPLLYPGQGSGSWPLAAAGS